MYGGKVSHWCAKRVRTGSSMKMKKMKRGLENGPPPKKLFRRRPSGAVLLWRDSVARSGRSLADSAFFVMKIKKSRKATTVRQTQAQFTACTPVWENRAKKSRTGLAKLVWSGWLSLMLWTAGRIQDERAPMPTRQRFMMA